MKITWYGHASFRIETAGVAIITDPYRSPDSGGYLPIDDGADIVVVSHENDRYHSHLDQIKPPFEVVRGLELPPPPDGRTVRGIRFHATQVYETPERNLGDEVTIIDFTSEGLKVVFLGDLGHALEPLEIAPLRGADILFIPAGGPPTIDYPLIPTLVDVIHPRLVIPMHYKTPKINLPIQPLERFLECFPLDHIGRPDSSWIEIDSDGVPMHRTIVLLNHAR